MDSRATAAPNIETTASASENAKSLPIQPAVRASRKWYKRELAGGPKIVANAHRGTPLGFLAAESGQVMTRLDSRNEEITAALYGSAGPPIKKARFLIVAPLMLRLQPFGPEALWITMTPLSNSAEFLGHARGFAPT